MSWLVCRFKDDNSLFITTRKARESMINTLIELGQEIESAVEKEFPTYEEANNYKKGIEAVNKKIDEL